ALFADDARATFGNLPSWVGVSSISDGIKAFFDTIAGIHHTLVRVWQIDGDAIAHVEATYRRKDGTDVTVPAVTIYHADGNGKIDDYHVFLDVTPIYV